MSTMQAATSDVSVSSATRDQDAADEPAGENGDEDLSEFDDPIAPNARHDHARKDNLDDAKNYDLQVARVCKHRNSDLTSKANAP